MIKTGWVYLLKDDQGRVKVGFTDRTVEERLREHQTSNGGRLLILAKTVGTNLMEDALKFELRAFRAGGGTEWFRLTKKTEERLVQRLCRLNELHAQRDLCLLPKFSAVILIEGVVFNDKSLISAMERAGVTPALIASSIDNMLQELKEIRAKVRTDSNAVLVVNDGREQSVAPYENYEEALERVGRFKTAIANEIAMFRKFKAEHLANGITEEEFWNDVMGELKSRVLPELQ